VHPTQGLSCLFARKGLAKSATAVPTCAVGVGGARGRSAQGATMTTAAIATMATVDAATIMAAIIRAPISSRGLGTNHRLAPHSNARERRDGPQGRAAADPTSATRLGRLVQAAVPAGSSNRPMRQANAKNRTAAPAKTPRAATETEAASACDAPTPEAASAAVPAPAWVAAPAGPIGRAAAAAPAQRNSSARGTSNPGRACRAGRSTPRRGRASSRRRTPTPALRGIARSCAGSASGRAGSAGRVRFRRGVATVVER
jgi:hypothetical protein